MIHQVDVPRCSPPYPLSPRPRCGLTHSHGLRPLLLSAQQVHSAYNYRPAGYTIDTESSTCLDVNPKSVPGYKGKYTTNAAPNFGIDPQNAAGYFFGGTDMYVTDPCNPRNTHLKRTAGWIDTVKYSYTGQFDANTGLNSSTTCANMAWKGYHIAVTDGANSYQVQ